jgi:hypothetical protein
MNYYLATKLQRKFGNGAKNRQKNRILKSFNIFYAKNSGFADVSYFSHVIRRQPGSTPQKQRKRKRKNKKNLHNLQKCTIFANETRKDLKYEEDSTTDNADATADSLRRKQKQRQR